MGASRRRRRHFFDDEAGAWHAGIAARPAEAGRAVSDAEVVPYDTAFLSGHVVEHYQVVLLDAAQRSLEQMHAKLVALCAQQVPGDTYRNLQIRPEYSGRTFKHVLVPVWLLSYNYGAKAYQVIVNGYTGTHRRPASVQRLEDRVRGAAGGHRRRSIVIWLEQSIVSRRLKPPHDIFSSSMPAGALDRLRTLSLALPEA